MVLYKLFDTDFTKKELICLVGAGGKTTTLFKLAKELKALNKKVLITTSTAIYYPKDEDYDKLMINPTSNVLQNVEKTEKGTITIIGRDVSQENKLLGLDKELIEQIHNKKVFDFILVEADGAKRKPIKAPASHEPVIPSNVDKTVGVIGLDAIDKKINEENVHRAALFCQITNSRTGESIDEEKIFRLITHHQGLFKDVPKGCKKYVLLNKVENEVRERKAVCIIDLLMKYKFDVSGMSALSLLNDKIVFKWSEGH